MILPKGEVEFTLEGGVETIRAIFSRLYNQRLSGYILVVGIHTGRLLISKGIPKLAEVDIDNSSIKSDEAARNIMEMMANSDNTIEWHSKIDTSSPMVFFKECKITNEINDINDFLRIYDTNRIQIEIEPRVMDPPIVTKEKGRFLKKLFKK